MKRILMLILFVLNVQLFGQTKSYDLVYKLFELTNTKAIMGQMAEELIGVQVRSNPNLAKYQDVMKEFFNKKVNYEILKKEMAEIYINEFSEKELELLVEFYQTDIGQKATEKMPLILQKSMMLGERVVSEELPALEEMIKQKKKQMLVEDFNTTKYVNYYSYDSTYSLSIPEKWNPNIQLLEGATFQAGDPENEMYLLVMKEEIPDSTENYFESTISDFVEGMTSVVENFNLIEKSEGEINDLIQKKISFSCRTEGLDLTYNLVGLKGDTNIYVILSWTLSEYYDSNYFYFEEAANSFREEG